MPKLLLPALKNLAETAINETMYVADEGPLKHAARY